MRQRVFFLFADGMSHSGQREASRLIFSHLDPARWAVVLIRLPALERTGGRAGALGRYLVRLAWAWLTGLRVLGARRPLLHVNLGQTAMALVRDGFLVRVVHWLRRDSRFVVSLHGSNFMEWPERSELAQRFTRFLSQAVLVTVLGESQRRRLIQLGVSPTQVRIVPNTCDAPLLVEADVRAKQVRGGPLSVLFLSSLIDTKGYPEFLESLLLLAEEHNRRVEAVLCGPVTASQFGERFNSDAEAIRWIEATTDAINRTGRVAIRWVRGAQGAEKWALYRDAQVFVLPTRYRVEAQPIVLLEAMAHGCAIICTTVGEIRSILSSDEALLLENGDRRAVATAIHRLGEDAGLRCRLALAGWSKFSREFSKKRYGERWEVILQEAAQYRAVGGERQC